MYLLELKWIFFVQILYEKIDQSTYRSIHVDKRELQSIKIIFLNRFLSQRIEIQRIFFQCQKNQFYKC